MNAGEADRAAGPEEAATGDVSPLSGNTIDVSGQLLGRYRLLRRLGRGGMAEVFLAERTGEGLEHFVALKRILPGLGSGTILERFLRERRILARLEHPGIARLLDGGSTPTGEPFFVLELVEGKPITEHCGCEYGAERSLPIAERLRLMVEVCEAVHSAHQRLVIHRDLKPSNILVTPEGRVKLLDFGIAKLLEPAVPDERTLADGRSLTPMYAAPEQLRGEPVTTATDVYALGILLFELLVGAHPFPRRGGSSSVGLVALAGETVDPPSEARRRLGSAGPSERQWVRDLEGDLDTVVSKAMDPDPARRYISAAALAEDLERYLARRPIRARRAGWVYRGRRFYQRHRWSTLGILAAVISLSVGLGVALRESAIAQREARRAERVREYLTSIFQEADPSGRRGATITAREVFDEGARHAAAALESDGDVHAEVLDAIARVQRNLGLGDEAQATARRALALREALHGADSPSAAESQLTLAEIALGRGDLEAARVAVEAASRDIEVGKGEVGQRLLSASLTVLTESADSEGALALAQAHVARLERTSPESLDLLRWRLRVAGLLANASRIAEAAPLAREALAALERAPGLGKLELARSRIIAADLYETAGWKVEAEILMDEAVSLERRLLGADHPDVALHEIKLGFTQIERRKFTEAEATLRHAIAVLRTFRHFEEGSALRYLGFAAQGQGRLNEAAEHFAAAELVYRATLGEAHPYVQSARLSRGWALMNLGRLADAEAVLRPVVVAFESRASGDRNSLRSALKYLGEVRRRRGDIADAIALHRRAKSIELEIFGTRQHPGVATSNLQLVRDLLVRPSRDGLAEARSLADEGLAILRQLDEASPRVDELLVESGRVALAQDDHARAQRDLREACDRLAKRLGEDHAETRTARALLRRAEAP